MTWNLPTTVPLWAFLALGALAVSLAVGFYLETRKSAKLLALAQSCNKNERNAIALFKELLQSSERLTWKQWAEARNADTEGGSA